MRQYTDSFLTPVMGSFSTTDNILTITETGNPAGYGILRFQLPISGALRFGVSFLVGYQNADHELLYNTGSMTPNKANVFICNPSDNSILYSRYNMKFDRSMLDAPQLSMAIPANDGLQIADLYVILGNNGSLYRDYQSAKKTDEQGQFIGTYEYIVDQYCKVIYERGEFHAAEPHLLTEDMPADVPELFAAGYPDILWRVDGYTNEGMIYSPLIPGMTLSGAFKDVVTLEQVTIPHTCQRIGPVAFAGTSLREVTIPADCEYSETSFPEGCEVHFYGGGGDYGQLYDCNGYAVIDSEHARIYIS